MRFLTRLLSAFAAFFRRSRSLPDAILDSEQVSRFIVQHRHFSVTAGLKPGAFLPGRDSTTSVFRTIHLPEDSVWKLGRDYVEATRGPVIARGDIKAGTVRKVQPLDLRPSEPPKRHAGIVSWPTEKHAQKVLALELAANATLRLKS